ncbi:MAG: vanadium-dependent haloperoxidase [Saprospiraceae bacterium]|nr:vanadium-dependent haloperoxidase [Saprospiraceae bacterium]
MKIKSILLLFFLSLIACNSEKEVPFDSKNLIESNRALLEIAMEDGFSPPQASRIYVYSHIAFYSCLSKYFPDSLTSLSKAIPHFPELPEPEAGSDPILSSLIAFCNTAKSIVFSESLADQLKDKYITLAKENNFTPEKIASSITTAEKISTRISEWIKKDNYQFTRTLERYTSSKKPDEWRETPPDYTQGLEPHWPKLRKLFSDSMPAYPFQKLPTYSKEKSSDFFKMVLDVHTKSKNLSKEESEIALFWDDNPNVSSHHGHLSHVTHKISPPGHWLNIISQIQKDKNFTIFQLSKAYTYSSIVMYDGIIDCWKLKYDTKVIRPISFIHDFIQEDWKPLIQTPPFPEFTSGHSVVSASAAEVLSTLIGTKVSFTDSTEVLFGNKPRSFNSFHDAAMEVSLSRYYGGIHYMQSVLEGNKQGIYLANYFLEKLNIK